ncbi:MAG TPA: PEP-CTERM sorting domain-containing protein [Coleofasciculaceae cyanobacterium]|jgi:hypothetical protein
MKRLLLSTLIVPIAVASILSQPKQVKAVELDGVANCRGTLSCDLDNFSARITGPSTFLVEANQQGSFTITIYFDFSYDVTNNANIPATGTENYFLTFDNSDAISIDSRAVKYQSGSHKYEHSNTFTFTTPLLGKGDYTLTFNANAYPGGGTVSDSKTFKFTVKEVPEPLTVFGSGIVLGFGVLFKKEHSRRQKKIKSLEKPKIGSA